MIAACISSVIRFKSCIIRAGISSVAVVISHEVGKSRATARILRTYRSLLKLSQSSASKRDKRSTCSISKTSPGWQSDSRETVQDGEELLMIHSRRSRPQCISRARLRPLLSRLCHGLHLDSTWMRVDGNVQTSLEILQFDYGLRIAIYLTSHRLRFPGSLRIYAKIFVPIGVLLVSTQCYYL